jgi:hypothetical protein
MAVVVQKDAVVRAVERVEFVYPASHFAKELKITGLSSVESVRARARLSKPLKMVFYRLAPEYGDGWVFERHPDGRVVMESMDGVAGIHSNGIHSNRLHSNGIHSNGIPATISPRGAPRGDPSLTAALLTSASLHELRLRLRSREHLLAMRQEQLEEGKARLLKVRVKGFEEAEKERLDTETESQLEVDMQAVEKLKELVQKREAEEEAEEEAGAGAGS